MASTSLCWQYVPVSQNKETVLRNDQPQPDITFHCVIYCSHIQHSPWPQENYHKCYDILNSTKNQSQRILASKSTPWVYSHTLNLALMGVDTGAPKFKIWSKLHFLWFLYLKMKFGREEHTILQKNFPLTVRDEAHKFKEKTWEVQLVILSVLQRHSNDYDIYTVSQKNPDPCDILTRLHQKSTDVGNFWQRQLHFISSSAFASNKFNAVENHLQFPWQWQQTCGCCRLTLKRWLSTKQSSKKRLQACVKAKGEHLEHLLWLAVAYCVLLRCTVSNNLNVSVIFANTAFYESRMLDSVSVLTVTLCLLVVLWDTCH